MASVKQLPLSLETPEDEPESGDPIEPKSTFCSSLMARVLDRNNLVRALKQVQRNKGSPGVDGMTVDDLPGFLKQYWPMLRQQLIEGTYSPKPVLRVEIPKPDGRKRKLGIPTVLDRLIQQAIAQIMQEEWDDQFHDSSYGFRPHRNAHQAIGYAQAAFKSGYDWVVDCDLEAFFDNVNHDLLMMQLKTHQEDATLSWLSFTVFIVSLCTAFAELHNKESIIIISLILFGFFSTIHLVLAYFVRCPHCNKCLTIQGGKKAHPNSDGSWSATTIKWFSGFVRCIHCGNGVHTHGI